MTGNRVALRRSRSDRMVAGVVGGIADYLGIDPTWARIGYVLISLFSAAFPGLLVYIILWLALAED